jgi:hypothetical protein
MTTALATIAMILIIALWYLLVGRAWLKTKSWARGFFSAIEPIEIALFKKSETVLAGRLLWFGGLIVSSYDAVAVFAQGLDLTPVTSRVLAQVPEDMRGLVVTAVFTLIGYLMVWLRKRTTKPIEIVAASDKDSTPNTVAAVAAADAASDNAVAAVTEAKAN